MWEILTGIAAVVIIINFVLYVIACWDAHDREVVGLIDFWWCLTKYRLPK